MMTAKEFLEQARDMETRIEALKERRQRYEDLAQSCTAHYRSGPGGTRRVSSVEEYAVKLADLGDEMALRVQVHEQVVRQIEAAIDGVEPEQYRTVLRLRYLNGWKWEKIAEKTHYRRQSVARIHGRALQQVVVPKDAAPVEDIVRRLGEKKGTANA